MTQPTIPFYYGSLSYPATVPAGTTNTVYGDRLLYPRTADALIVSDASIQSGTNRLVSPSGLFQSSHVGLPILIPGADVSAGNLVTTIAAVTKPTVATLATNASTTVNNGKAAWGVDHGPSIQDILVAISGKGIVLTIPPGQYLFATGLDFSNVNRTTLVGYGATFIAALISNNVTVLDTAHDLFFAASVNGAGPYNLNAQVNEGDVTMQVTGSAFVAGNVIIIANGARAATYTIQGVTPGGGFQTLKLDRPSLYTWPIAGSTVTGILSQPTQYAIEGITITGAAQIYHECLRGNFCILRNVTVDGSIVCGPFGSASSWDTGSYGCRYEGVVVKNCAGAGTLASEGSERCAAINCVASGAGVLNETAYQANDCALYLLDNCISNHCGSTCVSIADGKTCTIRGGSYSGSVQTGSVGVYLSACAGTLCDGVLAESNNGTGFFVDAGSTATTFTSCRALFNVQDGWVLNGTSGHRLIGCEASGSGAVGVQCNANAYITDFLSANNGGDAIVVGNGADVSLVGFDISAGTAINGSRGILINGTGAERVTAKNGAIRLPGINGGIQRGIYQNHAVCILDGVEIIAAGLGTTHGVEQITGDETTRIGIVSDNSGTPLTIVGHCSKSVSGSTGAPTVTLNGTTAVSVAWPNLQPSDRVFLSLHTRGATPDTHAPLVTLTPGTGFSIAGSIAGANDVYDYEVR